MHDCNLPGWAAKADEPKFQPIQKSLCQCNNVGDAGICGVLLLPLEKSMGSPLQGNP